MTRGGRGLPQDMLIAGSMPQTGSEKSPPCQRKDHGHPLCRFIHLKLGEHGEYRPRVRASVTEIALRLFSYNKPVSGKWADEF